MEQLQNNFNLKQREMFAKLLAQAKARIQEELEDDDSSVNRETEAELLPKLAEEHGATGLIADVRTLQKKLDDAETALSDLGFECGEDSISLKYDAPKALRNAVETAKRSARKERNQVVKKYDLAILSVWAADNAQDARKIVEGLL